MVMSPYMPDRGTGRGGLRATDQPGEAVGLEDVDLFLSSYADARARGWSDAERRVAWAASLWTLAFEAKKEWVLNKEGPLFGKAGGGAGRSRRLGRCLDLSTLKAHARIDEEQVGLGLRGHSSTPACGNLNRPTY
jgi:hypothetical protein